MYNLKNNLFLLPIFLLISMTLQISNEAHAQYLSKYGVQVITDIEYYKSQVDEDTTKRLVDLEEYIPGIKLDIRYATKDNFTGEVIYNIPKAFLRIGAADLLKQVQEELKKDGLELKIFDGYRPYSATVKFYEVASDTNYVASPYKGSKHNRGCAVDLTIINSSTGEEIEMPTPYDTFSEKAHSNNMDLPASAIKNRELLKSIMKKYHFNVIPNEWWHYDMEGWETYDLLDLSFESLISTMDSQ